MIYIYPKYSKYELIGVRFGGAGLGNLLFLWSRAIIAAKEHKCGLIWPTWPSIKLGPWIRKEKDKRFYANIFHNNSGMIDGLNKYRLLLLSPKIYCKRYDDITWEAISDGTVIICEGYGLEAGELQMKFDDLKNYRELIFMSITDNLTEKGQRGLKFDANLAINVHVRLGDFSTTNLEALAKGKNNTRIGIDWYVETIKKIRDAAGWMVPANVFSDGTDEELEKLLKLPMVSRVTCGNSIADIIALSKAPLIVPSGSSFSLWARFLGGCSSISYPHQMKDAVLTPGMGFEIENAENQAIPQEIANKIKEIYSHA